MLLRTHRNPRRGLGLALALGCLGLLVIMGGALLGLVRSSQRLLLLDHHAHQAAWLVQAGLERAAMRLAESPEFARETWTIKPDALDGHTPASVRIDVQTDAASPTLRSVLIAVELAPGSTRQVRISEQFTVDIRTVTQPQGD